MKGLMKKFSMLGLVSALGVAMVTQQAQAVSMLRISDGTTTVNVTDGDPFPQDLMGDVGGVLFVGPIGNFNVNVVTGLSKPILGSSEVPLMDINSVNVSSGTEGGELTIMYTDIDFVPLDGGLRALHFLSSIGGTTAGTVSYLTYLDENNTPFGTTKLLASLDGMVGSPFAFSADEQLMYRPENNYSLTMIVKITHEGANQSTSFNAELRGTPNPEPVTGALSFMGLGALTAAMRRRRTV